MHPMYSYHPIPTPATRKVLLHRTTHVLGIDSSTGVIQAMPLIKHLPLTMGRMMVVPDISIQHTSYQNRPMHLPPHVRAMIHVVFLSHVDLFVGARRDGRWISDLQAISIQVPLPISQREELVREFFVKASRRYPGE